jgi:hypothetical protein
MTYNNLIYGIEQFKNKVTRKQNKFRPKESFTIILPKKSSSVVVLDKKGLMKSGEQSALLSDLCKNSWKPAYYTLENYMENLKSNNGFTTKTKHYYK